MELRHAIVSLAVVAAVGGPIAGCGSSSSSSNASQSGGSNAVSIANFKFVPASLTVRRGTTLTVTNNDITAHTFSADNGDSFETGNINPNASAAVVLSRAGTFKYHCSIHPFMHGTLVVK